MSKIYITLELEDLVQLNRIIDMNQGFGDLEQIKVVKTADYQHKKRGGLVSYTALETLRIVKIASEAWA